jgi:hypothetical protein
MLPAYKTLLSLPPKPGVPSDTAGEAWAPVHTASHGGWIALPTLNICNFDR